MLRTQVRRLILSRYKLFFGAGSCTALALLAQNYLVKHNPRSSLYWRNQALFADQILQISHYKYIDRTWSLAKVFSVAQFNSIQLLKALHTLSPLHDLKKVFDKIDDKIDGA